MALPARPVPMTCTRSNIERSLDAPSAQSSVTSMSGADSTMRSRS